MDLTHWYFAVYENPYEHISDWLCRIRGRWRDMCSRLNIPYALDSGAWPHASLSAIWALTCQLIAGRSLKPSMQKHVIKPWLEMWTPAAGDDATAAAQADWGLGVEALQHLLPAQLQKSALSTMRKLGGQSLPHIAFACARCSGLMGQYGDEYLKGVEALGQVVMDLLEARFLGNRFQLSHILPAGALEHYAYRCGRSLTRKDPRTQAWE